MNRVKGAALLCASVLSFLLAGCGGGTPTAQKATWISLC